MEVFRIGDIDGKAQNTEDMKPPRKTLDDHEHRFTHIFKQRNERGAEHQRARFRILVVDPLENLVGRIHSENRHHQHDFGNEDDVGIKPGPAGHLIHPEAAKLQHVPADEEKDTRKQYGYGEEFENIHQHRIKRSEVRGENPVRSGKSVNNEFEYFDIDDEKAHIDKQVQYRRCGSLKHLLLTKGNQQHIAQPARGMVADFYIAAEAKGIADKSDAPDKEITGCYQYNNEKNLFEHGLVNRSRHGLRQIPRKLRTTLYFRPINFCPVLREV